MSLEVGGQYPRCAKGRRACPPEDCGGPSGYARLLRILSNPRHREYRERKEWVGGWFQPEHFSIDDVNADLKQLARRTGGKN